MAITKMDVYRNPPQDITDYEAIVEKLDAYARTIGGQGMILTEWTNASGWPKLAMGSYIFHGGASYVVDAEDYTIGEPSDGTYYLRIAASGETLAVSWISSLSGYVWNPIYNGLYHPDQSQILPYQLVVDGAVREKWKITNLAAGGGFITANWEGRVRMESVNTGQGDFKIGQNLRTTDAVTFATVDTGYGECELIPITHNHIDVSLASTVHNITIPAIAVGNIVIHSINATNPSSTPRDLVAFAPSTAGNYVVIWNSLDPFSGGGGKFSASEKICAFRAYGNFYNKATLLIYRVS